MAFYLMAEEGGFFFVRFRPMCLERFSPIPLGLNADLFYMN